MSDPLKIYIGWDGRDATAYEVCVRSILENTQAKCEIVPLLDWKLRYDGIYRRPYHVTAEGQRIDDLDGQPFSTDFSFTRFLVPDLENHEDRWVLFADPDMLWRADVADLFALADPDKAVMCVQHVHEPMDNLKMAGLMQTRYKRKNWSSLMLMNPARCDRLTKYVTNTMRGSWLHAMCWVDDELIGALPEEWNWLEGWSDPKIDPKIVHFTRGTPDLPGYGDIPYAAEWGACSERCRTRERSWRTLGQVAAE